MGISSVLGPGQVISPASDAGGPAGRLRQLTPAPRANHALSASGVSSALGHSREAAVARAFEAAVYHPPKARPGQPPSGATPTAAPSAGQQLEFDFLFNTRVEAVTAFTQRTAALAGRAPGNKEATLTELSREVAARFELSMSLSVSALEGFASAAGNTIEDGGLFGRFAELAQRLLGLAGEMFNEVFEFLGTFFANDTEENAPGDMVRQLLENLLAELSGGQGAGAPADGAQARQVQLEFRFTFEMSIEVSATQGEVQQGDPLILDLDGDGIELTSYTDGARFDLLGNGQPVRTAFVTGGDAFLALDRDSDGRIAGGGELFGEQRGAANGFEELRKLDSNADGVIDDLDRNFDRLLLWRDDGNGISEDGELITLAQAGIASISLGYQNVDQAALGGNRIAQIAAFHFTDGCLGRAADALLNYTV